MAKFKKTTAKKSTATKASAIADAERLSRSLSESAQQIWLAGVGAFSRAQAEGTKLFEGLVREGMGLEATVRKVAGGRADLVRDIVENRVGQARERATDTWDKLEKVFEDRVQRALVTLGVPSRDDLNDLTHRVEALTNELRRQGGKPAAAPRKAAKAAKAPAKKATRAAAAKPKKAAAKRAPRKAKAAAPAAE
jgi:poly(hydroxyalkanoate) granule-associated protein